MALVTGQSVTKTV